MRRWADDLRGIVIEDEEALRHLLPAYFRFDDVAIFCKMLRAAGFQKVCALPAITCHQSSVLSSVLTTGLWVCLLGCVGLTVAVIFRSTHVHAPQVPVRTRGLATGGHSPPCRQRTLACRVCRFSPRAGLTFELTVCVVTGTGDSGSAGPAPATIARPRHATTLFACRCHRQGTGPGDYRGRR